MSSYLALTIFIGASVFFVILGLAFDLQSGRISRWAFASLLPFFLGLSVFIASETQRDYILGAVWCLESIPLEEEFRVLFLEPYDVVELPEYPCEDSTIGLAPEVLVLWSVDEINRHYLVWKNSVLNSHELEHGGKYGVWTSPEGVRRLLPINDP
jgi:hypothetical protein